MFRVPLQRDIFVAAAGGDLRDGHVFLGPEPGRLCRSNFCDDWIKARTKSGVAENTQFHDLRHMGNALAVSRSSLRELNVVQTTEVELVVSCGLRWV